MQTTFRLDVSFNDETGQPVAAYLHVRDGQVAETKEVKEGIAFADYDEHGVLLGVELLGQCDLTLLDGVSQSESESVKRFIRGSAPHELICV